jgi:hypothetical protein
VKKWSVVGGQWSVTRGQRTGPGRRLGSGSGLVVHHGTIVRETAVIPCKVREGNFWPSGNAGLSSYVLRNNGEARRLGARFRAGKEGAARLEGLTPEAHRRQRVMARKC